MIDQYLFNCTNVLRKETHTWTGVPQQTTEPRSRGWFICRRLTGKRRHLAWKMTSDTSLPGEHQLQPRGRQHPGPALSHDGILKEKDHKNWSPGSGNHALQWGEAGEAPALQRPAYPQVPFNQVAGCHPQRQPLSSRVDVFAPLKCHVNQERGSTGEESVSQPLPPVDRASAEADVQGWPRGRKGRHRLPQTPGPGGPSAEGQLPPLLCSRPSSWFSPHLILLF